MGVKLIFNLVYNNHSFMFVYLEINFIVLNNYQILKAPLCIFICLL